jgi:hypothetical protein
MSYKELTPMQKTLWNIILSSRIREANRKLFQRSYNRVQYIKALSKVMEETAREFSRIDNN